MAITSGQLQKINRNEIRLLWHADFWDGPINGLCLYQNKKCWFEMQEEGDLDDAVVRKYLLIELSPQQAAEEERWHELFREKVGTHSDIEELCPVVRPRKTHRDFYEAYAKRAKPDYSNNPVIGWFELC